MINIRVFQKEDASQVAKLIKQLTKNIVNPDDLVSRLENMAKPPASTPKRGEKNYQYFVAEEDSQILGFAGLAWYDIPSKGLISWVEEVVVDEKARGKGVGKALMNKVLELADEKGCSQVKLTTGNPAAKGLYEKLGFIKKEENCFVKKNY